ncbi:transglutaminase family protein [Gammaproteobacteria bacterium]|nr:transglutaminase family protein [Gammaproteobacteria bacterium]
MAIKIAIKHHTEYRFDRLTSIMPHVVRLRPAPHCRTPIESYSLKVQPANHFINWQQDPFSNHLARMVFPEPTRKLVFDVEVIADMTVINPFDFFLDEKFDYCPFRYDKQLKKDLAPYLQITEKGPLLLDWLTKVDRRKTPTIDFLVDLNSRLMSELSYLVRMDPGVQTCEDTLTLRQGSCRDYAWLLVQILRHLGMAARFVSGYLVQLKADVKALDGPSGTEQDFTDLHAWAEVYIPGAGWLGMDATSGLFAGEGHIPLACTPDPFSAAPITGATGPCEVDFRFYNKVTRIHEDPRVTKPYSSAQWNTINALGKEVDKKLTTDKVKLTMGGEPTFVSVDDMDGAEWNTDALGEKKLELSEKLLQRLKAHYAPQGFIHHGQGKWYPGEQLPRWALGIFWRTDKKPLWHDPALLATPGDDTKVPKKAARTFLKSLCAELGLPDKYIVQGYEDKEYYLDKEGALPRNVSVADSKIKDAQERARIRKVFDDGLTSQTGYALPIAATDTSKNHGWQTSPWKFRRNKMFLVPGDSPMGLRLPLDSLPWEVEREVDFDKDPFSEWEPLAYPLNSTSGEKKKSSRTLKGRQKVKQKIIHTALCVQVRNDKLYIFMPPLTRLESYLELLGCIEKIATREKIPVVFEGYEPPKDPRLQKLMITPDPGVIEVNVHPAKSWNDLIKTISALYDQARECRLGTEKFMLDGKHTGTGGGNHVTLGAARAEDSPFLRKPHLLSSMLRYWQNHPSLSYLFSGQFIGPTSQAPRVDEARDDNLYELEIAMQQLPKAGNNKPWMIDRILRNFLVDLTGNTHRSEFCIDKLYSPDSSTGRLGLVEFRNFEMPPHWQMSAVQMLLIRSMVSWFWKKPYNEDFIRWGSQLHDRFMLPHYVWDDLSWVIKDLNDAGYPIDLDWFLPFQEFRFPHYGRFHVAGLQMDIHGAIEPWHVLGEEMSGGGTARYVDSSVERIQVKIQGMTGNRLAICCNGRKLPMLSTGQEGEFVAGIRYKAWDPYSALHPTIKVHTPLVIDVVDTSNNRSMGGCEYHVSHPGGRNYETFPVNANEAEARRVARFNSFGHTQGEIEIREEEPHPERPYTLDLRYLDI